MTNAPLSNRLRKAGISYDAYHVAAKPLSRIDLITLLK